MIPNEVLRINFRSSSFSGSASRRGDHHSESFRQKAQQERLAYVSGVVSGAAPTFSPAIKRRAGMFMVACMVATGGFWATMLASPPKTEAAAKTPSILEMQQAAPLDLPSMTADAI